MVKFPEKMRLPVGQGIFSICNRLGLKSPQLSSSWHESDGKKGQVQNSGKPPLRVCMCAPGLKDDGRGTSEREREIVRKYRVPCRILSVVRSAIQ